jgi:molybdopterin molybdotransferase
VTGNELVDPAQTPAAGEIRDSNSALIAGLLAEQRAKLIGQHRCGDTLRSLLDTADAYGGDAWDMLLMSGGASVGDYDFGTRFLRELGFTIHFDRINLRPGKPTIFGRKGRRVAFVIPGNPVSHFVVYHVAIRLALEALAGVSPEWSLIDVRLGSALPDQSDRRETYWPARVSVNNGALVVHPLAWKNSGNVGGLVSVNALLHLPGGGLGGSSVARCLLLDPPGRS